LVLLVQGNTIPLPVQDDDASEVLFTIPAIPAQTFTMKSLLEQAIDEEQLDDVEEEQGEDDPSEARFLFMKGKKKAPMVLPSVIRRRPIQHKKISIVQQPQQFVGRETVIYVMQPSCYRPIRIVSPAVVHQQQPGPAIVIEQETEEQQVVAVQKQPVVVDKKSHITSKVELISSVLTGLSGLAAHANNNAAVNNAAAGSAPEIVEPIAKN